MPINVKTCIFLGLLTVAQFASASQWSPTASDVNFFAFGPFEGWKQTGIIGIFEDTASIGALTNPVASFLNGATVTFGQHGSDWDITVSSIGESAVNATLLGSNNFKLGWLSNGIWIPQTGNNANPWTPNFWQLTFIDSALASNNTQTLYATNIQLSEPITQLSAVPLPAAAWSFLAGMMGVLALSKRHIN